MFTWRDPAIVITAVVVTIVIIMLIITDFRVPTGEERCAYATAAAEVYETCLSHEDCHLYKSDKRRWIKAKTNKILWCYK